MLLYLELFYVIIVFCAAIVRNKLLIKHAWSLSTTSDLEKEQVTFCRFAAHTGIQVCRPVYIDIWPFFLYLVSLKLSTETHILITTGI